ncbi:MAG: hypothetical protein R3C15_07250 [Thermoleophilia bacterium]
MDEPWPDDLTAAEAHVLASWPGWLAVEAAELGLLELVARGRLAVWADERPRRLRRSPALVPLGALVEQAAADAPWPLRSLSDGLAAAPREEQPEDVRVVRLGRLGDGLHRAGHGRAGDWGQGLLASLAARGLVEEERHARATPPRLTPAGVELHETLGAGRHDAQATVLRGQPVRLRTLASLIALGPIREALAAWQSQEARSRNRGRARARRGRRQPLPAAFGCIRVGLRHAGFANAQAGPHGGRWDPAPDAPGA